MRGDRQILQARLAGKKPTAIFVNVGLPDVPITNKYDDPENGLRFGLYPTVELLQSEMHKQHDFRFLANCTVHVHGPVMDEGFGLVLDQIADKAAHVIACAGTDLMEFKFGEWQAWTF